MPAALLDSRVGDQRPRLQSLPADIDNTEAGDEVIEFCLRFGLKLDDWQKWCVRHMCAERADGSWAATQSVLLVPRQCGKSKVLEAIEMAGLFLWDQQHIIYSAHLGKTATDHMRRIRNHINAVPDFRRQARLLTARGDERVERFDTGAILEFITRGKKSSRGGSPNLVIFDEAMFLTDEQIDAMLPAMSAQSMNENAAAQMIYASSAPIAESQVLHRLRKRALDNHPPRMFMAEWSAEAGCDPNDRDNWYQANPGLGIRISEEWIVDNEFGTLSPEGFAVERLGIPIEPIGSEHGPITLQRWSELLDPDSTVTGAWSAAVDVSPDMKWATIAAAGRRSDSHVHVEIVRRQPGTEWIIPFATAKAAELGVTFRIASTGPGGFLIPLFTEAGIPVEAVSAGDVTAACSRLISAVAEGTIHHRGGNELPAALSNATIAQRGDAQAWSRVRSSGDISALVAVTIAVGGVVDSDVEFFVY